MDIAPNTSGSLASWLRPPRRTLTVFVCLVLLLGASLAWLSWQVLERDRLLERSQIQDRLEQAADHVAAGLLHQLEALEQTATTVARGGREPLPEDVVVLAVAGSEVLAHPVGRLLFSPAGQDIPVSGTARFADAEAAEFERRDFESAALLYSKFSDSAERATRAAALIGLARVRRKAGRLDAALAAYDALEKIGDVVMAGRPADLAAREGRCSTLAAAGRTAELRDQATAVAQALWSGRWVGLGPSAWDYQLEQSIGWGAAHHPDDGQRGALVRSRAAASVIADRRAGRVGSGRRTIAVDGTVVLVSWIGGGDAAIAMIAGSARTDALLKDAASGKRVRATLFDTGHRVASGSVPSPDTPRASRATEISGLPWSLVVTSNDPVADHALFADRRRLLVGGFGVMMVVLAAGAFFITRSIQREAAVARLQTDFVSAVSHEFRTPLTSLRQLTEMLAKGRVPSDALKQETYDILARESERLQQLVESLLDFGRLEAGSYRYEKAPVDLVQLVRDTAAEVRAGTQTLGFEIRVSAPDDGPAVDADAASLGLAVRNVIDNAVKYSGASRLVEVGVRSDVGIVRIDVRDHGIGIPVEEQARVFQKFVRGEAVRQQGVAGTGIGLTLARQVVEAHGGTIRLVSVPGQGSTFTIELPRAGV